MTVKNTVLTSGVYVNKTDVLTRKMFGKLDPVTRAAIDAESESLLEWNDMVKAQYGKLVATPEQADIEPDVDEEDDSPRNRSGLPVAHVDKPDTWTEERLTNSPVRTGKGTNGKSLDVIARDGLHFNYNNIYDTALFLEALGNRMSVAHNLAKAVNKAYKGKAEQAKRGERLVKAMLLVVDNPALVANGSNDKPANGKASHKPKDSAVSLPMRDDDAATIANLTQEIATYKAALSPVTRAALEPIIASKEAELAELVGVPDNPERDVWLDKAERAQVAVDAIHAAISGKANPNQIILLAEMASDRAGYVAYCQEMAVSGDKKAASEASRLVTGKADNGDSDKPAATDKATKHSNFITQQKAIVKSFLALVGAGSVRNDAAKATADEFNTCGCVYAVQNDGKMSDKWTAHNGGCAINKAGK